MFSRLASRSLAIPIVLMVITTLIGSATVVVASNTSSKPIFRLGDGTDETRIATVDANGSLNVSQQGTITATVTNADFPDAGTHSRLDTTNSQLGKLNFDGSGNLKTTAQGTSQITGSVSVTNLPSDQQIHGTVTVSNPGASGVNAIVMPTMTAIASGKAAEWQAVDVSTCRTFSVAVKTLGSGVTGKPNSLHIYFWDGVATGAAADVHSRDGDLTTSGASIYGYPSQPGTDQPFYATSVGFYAVNGDGSTRDMMAVVYCQH